MANNANAQAGYIPLMAFGIPPTPTLAMLLAALVIFGVEPGPLLFTKNADFVWTIIGSMYVGNVILLILNLPLVGLWARIVYIPYKLLAPIILGLCFLGSYAIRDDIFDIGVAVFFGIVGYLGKKFDWPIPPVLLGFILGPKLEGYLRPSLAMSGGSGSSAHLAAELFKQMAGINLAEIPYKGAGPALIAVVGGEGSLVFANALTVKPHIESGCERALGIASPRRSAAAPGIPTIAESGLPGYSADAILGLLAPAKTPRPIMSF